MSGHKYIRDTKNLFLEDDDDIDDDTFLKNSRRTTYPQQPPVVPERNYVDQRQMYEERKKVIENRTIQSTERSISLLRDSEQVGIATAEELMRQREQLEKTDKRLDEINATLRFSQKHINGIKSVFGSLKNYLSGRSEQNGIVKQPPPEGPSTSSSGTLAGRIAEVDRFDVHPVTRLRGLDLDEDSRPLQQQQQSASKNFSQILDANLDEMHGQISRLKGLAAGLSEEIDLQNDLIENITEKTEVADMSIDRQNKDMNRLLK